MALQLPNRRTMAGLGVFLVAVVSSVIVAPSLPERLTTHWNAAGTPDETMSKQVVLLGGPAIVLGLVVFFELIPRIDPLAENITAFQDAYDALAVVLVAFMAYAYGFVLAWNLGYQVAIEQVLAPGIAVVYLAVGFLLERAERNWFIGIRTPWTLSSDTVWRHTHDRTAPLFKLSGLIALSSLLFPSYFVYFIAGPAAAIALFATVYSYIDYRRVEN